MFHFRKYKDHNITFENVGIIIFFSCPLGSISYSCLSQGFQWDIGLMSVQSLSVGPVGFGCTDKQYVGTYLGTFL